MNAVTQEYDKRNLQLSGIIIPGISAIVLTWQSLVRNIGDNLGMDMDMENGNENGCVLRVHIACVMLGNRFRFLARKTAELRRLAKVPPYNP